MELLHSEIFRNAFLAGTIVALMAAPVGYFLVLRANAFAGEALKDIGFAGATGAVLLGVSSLFGMIALSLLAAVGLGALSKRIRGRDVEVGMVLSFALGLGVLFLSMWSHSSAEHASAGVNILFGSMLSIGRGDLAVALGSGVVVAVTLAVIFRPLLFASVDPEVAEARGVPTRLLSLAFMLLLALTTATSVLVVGVLLVAALLVAPAAAAVNLTRSPLAALLVAVLLGLGAAWVGLFLAFAPVGRHLPVGFTVSALSAIAYLLSASLRRGRTAGRRIAPAHPSREIGQTRALPDRGTP